MLKPLVVFIFLSVNLIADLAWSDSDHILDLRFDKQEFLLGEPVVAYVTLRNNGNRSVSIIPNFNPEYHYATYFVKPDNSEEKQFRPWAFAEGNPTLQNLPPKESVVGTAKIFFGADGWTFPKPGKYAVRVTYQGKSSAPMVINIKPPATEGEKKQVELMMGSNEVGYFLLFEGGDHLREGKTRLQKLAKDYPESFLAGYANYALGESLRNDFADFSTNKLRKADLKAAMVFLDKSTDQLTGASTFYYSTKAYKTLKEIYQKTGNLDRARSLDKKFKKEVGDRLSPIKSMTPKLLDSVQKELDASKQ